MQGLPTSSPTSAVVWKGAQSRTSWTMARPSQAQVSKLENGKPEQNLETLRAFAETLRIPQHMLWFDFPGQTRIVDREDSFERLSNLALIASSSSAAQRPRQHDYPVLPTSSAVMDDDPVQHIGAWLMLGFTSSGCTAILAALSPERESSSLDTPGVVHCGTSGGTGEVEMNSKRAIESLLAPFRVFLRRRRFGYGALCASRRRSRSLKHRAITAFTHT